MTSWTMVADLRRCVGCQTCTAACKHANATAPAVQWRRVLDFETGSYPDVARTFVPVGCMHCSDPPCMHVCPSTATGQREDGIVTINYDICIGCSYCAVACPYQARYKVGRPRFAYGKGSRMKNEAEREDPARIGVAQKCTFCSDRIDFGLENGLTVGVDPKATPACVNSCIADALHFGDAEDPESNVSKLLAENASFKMHDELETDPNFHYIWETNEGAETAEKRRGNRHDNTVETLPPSTGVGGVGAAAPWLQQHWDWRAAGNFMAGGTGSGMIVVTALLGLFGASTSHPALLALSFVALGLFLVFLETGRPLRAPLHVFFHPQTSWMTREAMASVALFFSGIITALTGWAALALLTGLLGAGFLYSQARILTEAKGIPAWRNATIVPLIFTTGLVEGAGVYMLAAPLLGIDAAFSMAAMAGFVLITLARAWAWWCYHAATALSVPDAAYRVIDRFHGIFLFAGTMLPTALVIAFAIWPNLSVLAQAAAIVAVVAGWLAKFMIVTQASYNQGFALLRLPQKGGGAGPGAKPGWKN